MFFLDHQPQSMLKRLKAEGQTKHKSRRALVLNKELPNDQTSNHCKFWLYDILQGSCRYRVCVCFKYNNHVTSCRTNFSYIKVTITVHTSNHCKLWLYGILQFKYNNYITSCQTNFSYIKRAYPV